MSEPKEKQMVHVRLDKELVRKIDHLAIDWGVYRHEAIERLLAKALQEDPQFIPYRMQGQANTYGEAVGHQAGYSVTGKYSVTGM